MSDADVVCWQHAGYWVFYCRSRQLKPQIIHMCRQQLGKSHGEASVWQVCHVKVPHLPDHPPVSVVMVKDAFMATQLKLQFT